MADETLTEPKWVEKYRKKRISLSGCVERWEYVYQAEHSCIYICRPYPGIFLWANQVNMHELPSETQADYPFIKLNYCTEGRCEMGLENDKYFYLEKGMLSIDRRQPTTSFFYPTGRYSGLEVVLNLKELAAHPPAAFLDCGIDFGRLEKLLAARQGSYLATVTDEWHNLAETVIKRLQAADGRIEDFRFLVLQLFYLLSTGCSVPREKAVCVTKGQRLIAAKAEKQIRKDLKRHYTVEELAGQFGVSPSSLKKYFEQVYGMPISEYLREKRMALACELLVKTRWSVGDVAAEAGYANQGKFGGAFKRFTGHTPLEYRRLYSERSIGE